MDSIVSPLSTVKGFITQGYIYTVKKEHYGYSHFAKRNVEAYEFYEIEGYYEKGIFIPLSNIDETEMYRKVEEINICDAKQL